MIQSNFSGIGSSVRALPPPALYCPTPLIYSLYMLSEVKLYSKCWSPDGDFRCTRRDMYVSGILSVYLLRSVLLYFFGSL